jgi:hypothetical protein
MAFVRKKGKYYQLVENRRNRKQMVLSFLGHPTPKQKVLAHLGKYPTVQDAIAGLKIEIDEHYLERRSIIEKISRVAGTNCRWTTVGNRGKRSLGWSKDIKIRCEAKLKSLDAKIEAKAGKVLMLEPYQNHVTKRTNRRRSTPVTKPAPAESELVTAIKAMLASGDEIDALQKQLNSIKGVYDNLRNFPL